jgi:hypothetical protein
MADDSNAKFKAVITAEDQTAGAMASVERAFEKLGFTAAQVEKELEHLKEVDEDDNMAQHFVSAEAELRRMGLTAAAVKTEMERLHAVQAAISADAENTMLINPADHFAMRQQGIDAAMAAHLPGRDDGMVSMADYLALKRYNEATAEHEEGGSEEAPKSKGRKEGEEHEGGEHEGRERRGHGWTGLSEHIEILHDRFGELRETIGESGESLGEMLPMLGAFAAFGSAEGIMDMIHDTVEEQAALAAMSKQLGTTVDQLEAFHYAAKMTDVPVDTMDRSLAKLGVTMEEAASGKNKLAAEMFHKMGISIEDAHHHMEPLSQILPQVAEAIKNTTDPQMRLYLATTLFGRAGKDLLPLLIMGRDGMKDLTNEADKLGPALTDVDRDHLQQFNDSWKQAEYVSQSFMTRLSADLAPVMTPLLDDFTQWMAVNKDWISLDVAHGVKDLGDALKAMPWGEALKDASHFEHWIASAAYDVNALVDDTIGWQAALLGLLGIKLIGPFAQMIRDLKELIGLTKDLTVLVGKGLSAAWNTAAAAEEAYDDKFKGSLTGRLVATAFATYDVASQGSKVDLNPAQQKLLQSFHLQAGQSPTPAEIKQLDALSSPGQARVEGGAAPAKEWAVFKQMEHFLGIPDGAAAAPAASAPGAPSAFDLPDGRSSGFGRWAPLPQVPWTGAPAPPVGNSGTVTHHVVFENVPPNVSITTTTTGDVGNYQADVGYNLMVAGPN